MTPPPNQESRHPDTPCSPLVSFGTTGYLVKSMRVWGTALGPQDPPWPDSHQAQFLAFSAKGSLQSQGHGPCSHVLDFNFLVRKAGSSGPPVWCWPLLDSKSEQVML